MNSCIAILTRGYDNQSDYSLLLKRNKCIENNLDNKNIQLLIFHEGNIQSDDQKFICEQTPSLKIKFVDILEHAFKKEKESIIFEKAPKFGIGYRHMCSFWFVDFWNFVKEYDYMLRIDEDCFIDFKIDDIFPKLETNLFIAGQVSVDCDFVTEGLNQFSLDFIKKYSHEYTFKQFHSKWPSGPYTNVFGISLNKIQKNEIFQKYLKEIDSSEMIYKRRWGDLPLWGEAIDYIFGSKCLYVDKSIKYFHGSHNSTVN
jgi:hypothetical protein